MKLITLGECDKNLIYPLFGGISKFIVNLILYFFPDGAELNKHPFMLGINAGFGMSLAVFPYIYLERYSESHKKEKQIKNKSLEEIKKRNNPKIKKEKYLIIFLCALMDFVQKVLVFIFHYSITNNIWIFNIVFLNVFTYMLYKTPIYKHHLLSMGIMILFGIGLNVVNLYSMKKEDLSILFLSMFIEIIYSMAIVLAKYGMDYKFCSPFEITFYEGIFALIFNIIFLIISTNVPLDKNFKYNNLLKVSEYKGKKYIDNFYTYTEHLDFIEILLFIVTMIGRVLFNLFSHITIKNFTSSHVILLLIMGEISLDWAEKKTSDVLITAGIFIVELFMLLVFCELIELNFCGLEENTKRNIKERAKLAQYDQNDDSRDSKEIWDGLELSSESQSSINNSF